MKNQGTNGSTPFMMRVNTQLEVFDNETGQRIPNFTGLCTSTEVTDFWLLGTSRGERSFKNLYSRNLRDARIEARYYRIIRRIMAHHEILFADAMTVLFLRSSSEGKWCGQVIREAFESRHKQDVIDLDAVKLAAA
jgi:hypothetical protein